MITQALLPGIFGDGRNWIGLGICPGKIPDAATIEDARLKPAATNPAMSPFSHLLFERAIDPASLINIEFSVFHLSWSGRARSVLNQRL